MPDDVTVVAQWAKSSRAPSEVYNAACRVLNQRDTAADDHDDYVSRLRADHDVEIAELDAQGREAREERDKLAAELATRTRERNEAARAAETMTSCAQRIEAKRDTLKAAIEMVEKDLIEQQKKTGTTKDPWQLGVYAQASRTRCILRDALAALDAPEIPVSPTEGHENGLTPRTLGASEGDEAREAQEASQ